MRIKSDPKTARCMKHNLSPSYCYKIFHCDCEVCKKWKSEAGKRTNDMVLARERSREWRLNNVERSRQNSLNYQKKHPEKLLQWQLKKYKLTLEEYYRLNKKQDGKCAICGNFPNSVQHGKNRLCIDHDKNTKKVRGLLCGACNLAIGHLNHSTVLLLKAVEYLKKMEMYTNES